MCVLKVVKTMLCVVVVVIAVLTTVVLLVMVSFFVVVEVEYTVLLGKVVPGMLVVFIKVKVLV